MAAEGADRERMRRVLITGVSNYWGNQLARRLLDEPGIEAVIGIDDRAPVGLDPDVELIEADLRSQGIARIVARTQADTIVHNDIHQLPGPGRSQRNLHDVNVVGTLQLLAACSRLPALRGLVVRGSAAIYGAEAGAPLMFREEQARRYPLRTRFQRDIGELERLLETFARRRPEVACTVLRFQPVVGTTLQTPITRLLSAPLVPTFLGYDPRVQFLHEEDSVGVLLAAMRTRLRGAVNVASPGTVALGRALRMLGKLPLPLAPPLFRPGVTALRRAGMPIDLTADMERFLRYGRGVDVTRMREGLGFEPRGTTEEILLQIGHGRRAAA